MSDCPIDYVLGARKGAKLGGGALHSTRRHIGGGGGGRTTHSTAATPRISELHRQGADGVEELPRPYTKGA